MSSKKVKDRVITIQPKGISAKTMGDVTFRNKHNETSMETIWCTHGSKSTRFKKCIVSRNKNQ